MSLHFSFLGLLSTPPLQHSLFDYVHLARSFSNVGYCYCFWFGNRENGAPSEFVALLIDRFVWIRRTRDRLQPHYHFSLWGRPRHSLNSVCKWVFNASQPHSCNQNMEKKNEAREILHTFLNVPPADMYAYISYCHRLHIVCYLHRYSVAGVALVVVAVVCYGCCCCKI